MYIPVSKESMICAAEYILHPLEQKDKACALLTSVALGVVFVGMVHGIALGILLCNSSSKIQQGFDGRVDSLRSALKRFDPQWDGLFEEQELEDNRSYCKGFSVKCIRSRIGTPINYETEPFCATPIIQVGIFLGARKLKKMALARLKEYEDLLTFQWSLRDGQPFIELEIIRGSISDGSRIESKNGQSSANFLVKKAIERILCRALDEDPGYEIGAAFIIYRKISPLQTDFCVQVQKAPIVDRSRFAFNNLKNILE